MEISDELIAEIAETLNLNETQIKQIKPILYDVCSLAYNEGYNDCLGT